MSINIFDLPRDVLNLILKPFSQKEQGRWLTVSTLFKKMVVAHLETYPSLEFMLTTEDKPLYCNYRPHYENQCPLVHDYSQVNDLSFKEGIKQFSAITELNLERCGNLSPQTIIEVVATLDRLKELNLSKLTQIDEGSFLQIAEKASGLIKLDLSETNVTGTALMYIALRCSSLATLNIAGCKALSADDLLEEGSLPASLTSLDISTVRVPYSTHLEPLLDRLTHLTKLYFMPHLATFPGHSEGAIPATTVAKWGPLYEELQIGGFKMAEKFSRLNSLYLFDFGLSLEKIKEAVRANPLCRALTLGFCFELDDATLLELVGDLPQLTYLDLQYLQITGEFLIKLAEVAPQLAHLSIHHCEKVSSKNILAAIKSMPNLKYVNLNHKEFTETRLEADLYLGWVESYLNNPKPSQLQHMNLNRCPMISEAKFLKLLQPNLFPDLQTLDISNCHKITNATLCTLPAAFLKLKKINLFNCPQITEETIQVLKDKGLEVLFSSEPFHFENVYTYHQPELFHYTGELPDYPQFNLEGDFGDF